MAEVTIVCRKIGKKAYSMCRITRPLPPIMLNMNVTFDGTPDDSFVFKADADHMQMLRETAILRQLIHSEKGLNLRNLSGS